MANSDDKNWATKYLLDPLNEPEPSDETGPGTHFSSTMAPAPNSNEKSKNGSSIVSEVGSYPTPPHSASPNHARFSQSKMEEHPWRASSEIPTSSSKSSILTPSVSAQGTGRRRGSSFHERYPGDESAKPLDMIRKSSLRAQRSPHLRKSHHHGTDSIDRLAGIDVAYHIGGPFDAASQARNVSSRDSPVAALKSSNIEALRATPREAVIDSLRHHRPLDGTAALPPGVPDRSGRILRYKEDQNLLYGMGHWEDMVDYHPDDFKGKGEPSFTIERALKNHEKHKRAVSEGYELKTNYRSSLGDNNPFSPRARASSGSAAATTGQDQSYKDWETDLHRSKSARGLISRKLGSLRRRHRNDTEE